MGTVLLLNTNDTSVVNNNQQIQAREICIAGLDVMYAHMEKSPNDYSTALANGTFSLEVKIPYKVYADSASNTYLDSTDEFSNTPVIISVEPDPVQPTDGTTKLIATAKTDYALTGTQVKLEILYLYKNGSYVFERRFIN